MTGRDLIFLRLILSNIYFGFFFFPVFTDRKLLIWSNTQNKEESNNKDTRKGSGKRKKRVKETLTKYELQSNTKMLNNCAREFR